MATDQYIKNYIFDQLQGNWTFERTYSHNGASMIGKACFCPIQIRSGHVGYHYHEQGTLLLQHKSYVAYADYGYFFCSENQEFTIYKWDTVMKKPAQIMHRINFKPKVSNKLPIFPFASIKSIYYCQLDKYILQDTFFSYTSFNRDYQVIGPYKKYHICTKFNKKNLRTSLSVVD